MKWEHEGKVHEDCAVFRKTKDEFGGLSNMAAGFPLKVNGHEVLTSEALYQACRFPDHPDIQREVIEQASPMAAKMVTKREGRRAKYTRPDWDAVNVRIMEWCLWVKLAQNLGPFYWLLQETGERAIVEHSHRDRFWGAVLEDDDVLRGENVLGRLLMKLRDVSRAKWDRERDSLRAVEPLDIPNFKLLGEAIRRTAP
jgi:ribA/ribD-fused uncharacterized protein